MNNTEPPRQPTVATHPRLYWVLVARRLIEEAIQAMEEGEQKV